MNRLLRLTALLEAPTGLALLLVPGLVVHLLLRAEISGAAFPLSRMAGAAVLALSVACWRASCNAENCAARGLVAGMAIYNFGAVIILGASGIQAARVGILLWPVVILHAAMAAWCGMSLRRNLQKLPVQQSSL